MNTYDPILSGPLNLYNVTLAILTAIALGLVIIFIVRDAPDRRPPRGRVRMAIAGTGLGLLLVGAVVFVLCSVSHPTEDVADWGLFYLLPAALLVGVAVLGVIRPVHAGSVLIGGAILAVVVVSALGGIADTIDPRWAVDQIDAGSAAAAALLFSLPAALSGLLLLVGGTPTMDPGTRPTGNPHPA